jgi:hypothetical protein
MHADYAFASCRIITCMTQRPVGLFKARKIEKYVGWVAVMSMVLTAAACVGAFLLVKRYPLPSSTGDGEFFPLWIAFVLASLALVVPIGIMVERRRVRFWQAVAASYGWTYARTISVKGDTAVMFRQGHGRTGRYALSGTLHGMPFRMFQYHFMTPTAQKRAEVWTFTVFEFTFKGRFPHLYLNYHYNYNPSFLERLRLPRVILPPGFERYFTLYAPKQYEVEALEIFTPDMLAFLLDSKWAYDVEMLEHRMLVFGRSDTSTVDTFTAELERVSSLVKHLEAKLHRMRFEPIGDTAFGL